MTAQIKSKQRVADHGEVLTGAREVNAMLDLVKRETERIESRFLEPACGTGNFLVEILRRKLRVVDKRYSRSQLEWERNGVTAVSSIYGIDILPDNAEACRERLFAAFDARYSALYNSSGRDKYRDVIRYVLDRNVICGDALTLTTVGPPPGPIIFSEWSPVNGSLFKRRDYAFHELLGEQSRETGAYLGEAQKSLFGEEQPSLFEGPEQPQLSDQGVRVFIPEPVCDHPLVHFLEIAHAYDR